MFEKGKISAFQMAIMMYPTIVGTAIIAVPAIMGEILL
jgi:spore germination protein KB